MGRTVLGAGASQGIEENDHEVAWSTDGKYRAAISGYQVYVWNVLNRRQIGGRVIPVTGRTLTPSAFTDTQIETLARAEHACWVIEPMRDGWKPGTLRHALHKMSPTSHPGMSCPRTSKSAAGAACARFRHLWQRLSLKSNAA